MEDYEADAEEGIELVDRITEGGGRTAQLRRLDEAQEIFERLLSMVEDGLALVNTVEDECAREYREALFENQRGIEATLEALNGLRGAIR